MKSEVKRTERSDKIKLEDMTLGQIRELKEGYQIRVAEALTAIRNEFMKKYDCGFPIVKVYSDVEHVVLKMVWVNLFWRNIVLNVKSKSNSPKKMTEQDIARTKTRINSLKQPPLSRRNIKVNLRRYEHHPSTIHAPA